MVLNGVPGKWIQCKKGLRQGDPLSPYLFIIVADLLQRLILDASTRGLLEHPLFQDLTHPVLQYADDTLIIVKADAAQLSCLKDILDQFSSYTGLSINFDKSTFVPIDIHHDTSRMLAAIFGCSVACFPQTYLGLPLTVTKLKQSELQSIIRAVEGYIPTWCGKALTPSWRTVLVNSVLSARVVYPNMLPPPSYWHH